MGGDRVRDRIGARRGGGIEVLLALDIGSKRVEGDSRIARGARHARIDVGDAYRNVGPQFGGEIDRDAKAATAVVARRRNHAEQRVDPPPLEERADSIVAKRQATTAERREGKGGESK